MGDIGHGTGLTSLDEETTSFNRHLDTPPESDSWSTEHNHLPAEAPASRPGTWNWVMIVAIVCSLIWYISKLPDTLGLH